MNSEHSEDSLRFQPLCRDIFVYEPFRESNFFSGKHSLTENKIIPFSGYNQSVNRWTSSQSTRFQNKY